MRHRLRERAQPESRVGRRRERKSRAVPAEEVFCQSAVKSEENAPYEAAGISELDELLSMEEVSGWWKEDEQPEDSSLADLLHHLVDGEDDGNDDTSRPPQAEVRPSHKEAISASLNMAAASAPSKMAARARFPGNKNALAARLNRLRKKEYVSGLEGRVARLTDENQRLERDRRSLGARVRYLEEEARYLRAVLANDSALSKLLGRLTGMGGVKLATTLFRDTQEPADHDYALPRLSGEEEEEDSEAPIGGVCLHVDKEKVSVEFCSSCARNASSSAKM